MTDQELREHRQTHDKSNSWWMCDTKGIELCRVCDDCEQAAIDLYPPEVTGVSGCYEDVVEETIEDY